MEFLFMGLVDKINSSGIFVNVHMVIPKNEKKNIFGLYNTPPPAPP